MRTVLIIKGTHCNSCKILIEDICKELGAKSCEVDFKTGETIIEHDESFDFEAFKKEVESLGQYQVQIKS
jgi:copper chaperone CopZ